MNMQIIKKLQNTKIVIEDEIGGKAYGEFECYNEIECIGVYNNLAEIYTHDVEIKIKETLKNFNVKIERVETCGDIFWVIQ